MKEFAEVRNHISVYDHAYNGALFTWTNKHQEGFIARKLDRVLINDSWSDCFAHSTVEFLPPEVSDHCPSLIQIQQDMLSPPKPFKFFNLWTKHVDFLPVVENSWNEPVPGNTRSVLHYKLKRLKSELKNFNQKYFGGISTKVGEKRKELASVQMKVLKAPTEELVKLEKSLTLELYDLIIVEESFFRQKSRISWIQEGDQNTRFFYKSLVMQQHRSTIRTLTNEDGLKLNTFSQIAEEAVSYFQVMLGTRDSQVKCCSVLSELIQTTLPNDAEADLCKPVTDEEIKMSMFAIGDEKAPGPDGYNAHFLRKLGALLEMMSVRKFLTIFIQIN